MDFIWIFLVITAIVYLLLRYYPRKQKTSQVDNIGMDSLGFQPVPYPEAIVKKKVVQLHTKYEGQQLAIQDVFQYSQPQIDTQKKLDLWIFLFDIEDQAGKTPTILAQDVIAVISTRVNLPRISIFTRPNATGRFGSFMDRFLSRLAVWDNNTQLLKQINFPEMPAIEKRYLIFSNDENHARDFLSPARLLFLQNLSEHYAIDMGGDIFTIHQVISSNNMSRRECIFQTLKTAREMIQIFSDSPVKLDG